jgi:hypothetical protein
MENDSMLNTKTTAGRPVWKAPKLQELGNLRTLVRVGNANGKSGGNMDGNANCGGEAMGFAPECVGVVG